MGRHSDSSSTSTTLAELGTLARRGLTRRNDAGSPVHRAESTRLRTSPAMLRASGAAATLALAISGGAYAAVEAGSQDVRPLTETQVRLQAIGSAGVNGQTTGLAVEGGDATITTVTEDQVQAHTSVEQPTDTLPAGETQVQTAGADGLVRVTYHVVTENGVEVSREVVSSVVVTAAVEEVVLVGTGAQSSAPSPTPAPVAPGGTSAAAAQAIAQSMMSSYGWNDSEFSCLVSLWQRESGWNYQAQNPSSGAYGIPQALPGSKMGSVAADWATNPATQITWGLGYIQGRYGSPCAAWAHSNSVGWY